MDDIIITIALIVGVLSFIEIISFLLKGTTYKMPVCVSILPIFSGDEKLFDRIELLSLKGCGRRKVILVDYNATPTQSEFCKKFVECSPDALYISHNELEELLKEIFD